MSEIKENNETSLKFFNDPLLDLFFNLDLLRGRDIISRLEDSYEVNPDLLMKIALYTRDIKNGLGERQLFRDMIKFISKKDANLGIRVAKKIPELGRWDDLFSLEGEARQFAFNMIGNALKKNNKLCAKWMPRKGPISIELRNWFGMSPKQWRRLIVDLTDVVESKMCNNSWSTIKNQQLTIGNKILYKNAFRRHNIKLDIRNKYKSNKPLPSTKTYSNEYNKMIETVSKYSY